MNTQSLSRRIFSGGRALLALGAAALLPVCGALASAVYTLNVGDPHRKDHQVAPILDGIRDSRTGEVIDPAELARRLEDAAYVLIGEDHTNMDFHQVQLQVIRALHTGGRTVVIGLEMFPYVDQPHLDQWSAGELSADEFLARSQWYARWGYPWGYYRDIFAFARDHKLAMWGINAPRQTISRVRQEGWDSLSEDDRAHLPPRIDTESEEHMALFKAYFQSDDAIHGPDALPEAALRSMFEAQVSWDGVMAYNAVRARQAHPDAVVVVLAGGGHVAYGLGIARQLAAWDDGRAALVMPVPVRLSDGTPLDRVQASYGDYLWGVPPVTDPVYPVLGLATMNRENGVAVLDVETDSTAHRAGVRAGDLIVTLNDQSVADRGAYARIMAGLSWGDAVSLGLERDGSRLSMSAVLRRRESGRGQNPHE
jgi:uncharacterized iron-regulated protein